MKFLESSQLIVDSKLITHTDKMNRFTFNPVNVVGLGTTAGVGIGTTITFVNPGVGATQKFIQTKALYIRNHNLRTGDQVTYSPGT